MAGIAAEHSESSSSFRSTQLSWQVTSDSAQLLDEGTSSAMLANYNTLSLEPDSQSTEEEMHTQPLFLHTGYSPGCNKLYKFPWTEPQGKLKHILLLQSFILVKNGTFHLLRNYGGECFIDNICQSSFSLSPFSLTHLISH